MSVAMTFGGALITGPRNATTTISVQSRSFERHLCTFCKGFRLQIDRSAFFVNRNLAAVSDSEHVGVFDAEHSTFGSLGGSALPALPALAASSSDFTAAINPYMSSAGVSGVILLIASIT
jgi:hypothetical protein